MHFWSGILYAFGRQIRLTSLAELRILMIIIGSALFDLSCHRQQPRQSPEERISYYAGIAITLAAFENNLSIIYASLSVIHPVIVKVTSLVKSTFLRTVPKPPLKSKADSPRKHNAIEDVPAGCLRKQFSTVRMTICICWRLPSSLMKKLQIRVLSSERGLTMLLST